MLCVARDRSSQQVVKRVDRKDERKEGRGRRALTATPSRLLSDPPPTSIKNEPGTISWPAYVTGTFRSSCAALMEANEVKASCAKMTKASQMRRAAMSIPSRSS